MPRGQEVNFRNCKAYDHVTGLFCSIADAVVFTELGKKTVKETISAVSWEQLIRNHQRPGVRRSVVPSWLPNVAAVSLFLKYRPKGCIYGRF